jgi:hypothetical protein
MKKSISQIIIALFVSILTLVFSYLSLGWLVMIIFAFGYLGGFIFWLLFPNQVSFADIKLPYWLTIVTFLFLHKTEEKYMKFFETISVITGVPVPSSISFPVIMMLVIGAVPWLLIPILIKRKSQLGIYLAWTFFASMGITELAHFLVFPFLTKSSYNYFPGMASVVILAPLAWWGMYKLILANKILNQ